MYFQYRHETWCSSVVLFSSEGGADNNGADSPDTNGKLESTYQLTFPFWKMNATFAWFLAGPSWLTLTTWFVQQGYDHTILFWHIVYFCITGNGNGRHKPIDIQKGTFISLLKHLKHLKERELQCVSGFVHRWPSSRPSRHQYVSSNKTHN